MHFYYTNYNFLKSKNRCGNQNDMKTWKETVPLVSYVCPSKWMKQTTWLYCITTLYVHYKCFYVIFIINFVYFISFVKLNYFQFFSTGIFLVRHSFMVSQGQSSYSSPSQPAKIYIKSYFTWNIIGCVVGKTWYADSWVKKYNRI